MQNMKVRVHEVYAICFQPQYALQQEPACKSHHARASMQVPSCKIHHAKASMQEPPCKNHQQEPAYKSHHTRTTSKNHHARASMQEPPCKNHQQEPPCKNHHDHDHLRFVLFVRRNEWHSLVIWQKWRVCMPQHVIRTL